MTRSAFVFGIHDGTHGTDLAHVRVGSVERLQAIAEANGWGQITYSAREERQRRVVERELP